MSRKFQPGQTYTRHRQRQTVEYGLHPGGASPMFQCYELACCRRSSLNSSDRQHSWWSRQMADHYTSQVSGGVRMDRQHTQARSHQ